MIMVFVIMILYIGFNLFYTFFVYAYRHSI